VQDLEAKIAGERTRLGESQERMRQEQKKAQDANREIERFKAKLSTAEKLYMVQKGEFEVWKDRYRTLEQRLNRSLREIDALQRGVLALEKRLPHTSVQAARAEVAMAEAARLAASEAAAAAASEEPEARPTVEPAAEENPPPIGPEPASPPPSPEAAEAGFEAKGEREV
jgi:chromosome segregation ATPase